MQRELGKYKEILPGLFMGYFSCLLFHSFLAGGVSQHVSSDGENLVIALSVQQGCISIITTLTFRHLPPLTAPISDLQLPF